MRVVYAVAADALARLEDPTLEVLSALEIPPHIRGLRTIGSPAPMPPHIEMLLQ